jgi:hypothetical protein
LSGPFAINILLFAAQVKQCISFSPVCDCSYELKITFYVRGVISPLLANIYLHYAFDQWVQHWRKQPGRGTVIVVRYADDSVVGFETAHAARTFLDELQERFAKFGLALHPDKTRLFEFGRFATDRRRRKGQQRPETFDFLGFTHCCGTDRQGKFQVIRVTSKKRMRATLAAIRETLYRRRHEPVPVLGAWLNRVLRGYFEYHAVPTNLKRLEGFRAESCRAWRHALLRRSQRHRFNWERFNRLTRKYVPPCRVQHPYPEERSSRHDLRQEPYAVTPPVRICAGGGQR